MNKINQKYVLDKLIKISYTEKTIDTNFVYLKEKRTFFNMIKIKEGIYYKDWYDDYIYYTVEELLKEDYLVEDNIVYHKPIIKFKYVDGYSHTIMFETNDEMLKAYNDFIEKNDIVWAIYK